MLALYKLTLAQADRRISEPVLRREAVDRCLLAEQVLEAAHEEAQRILEAARECAETLCEQARRDTEARVWGEAERLLDAWRASQALIRQRLHETARELLVSAWGQLFGELPEAARLDAVLHQLCAVKAGDAAAVVYCHPDLLATLSECLAARPGLPWTARSDPGLAGDTLCLRTEHGDFELGWQTLRDLPGEADEAPAQPLGGD